MRLLVVDDSDDTAMTMALLLKHFGHEAAVAESGQAALQVAPTFRPDAMFIDLAMPGIDGFDVVRQLRQQAEFAETPMVAVSGYVDAEHRTQATVAGFTAFLAKPYTLEALQAITDRVASRINATRERISASRAAAAQSRQLQRALRESQEDYRRNRQRRQPCYVSVEKSGISHILTLPDRSAADELRQWLKLQRCRVGPVFEPDAGQLAFFVYAKRYCIHELIAKHGGFSVKATA